MKYAAPSLQDLSNDRLKRLMPRIDAEATLQKRSFISQAHVPAISLLERATSEITLQTIYVMKGDLTSSFYERMKPRSRKSKQSATT